MNLANSVMLVTGGAGFIGSAFIRRVMTLHEGVKIVNLDALTYAGNVKNLQDVNDNPRYRFVRGNICLETNVTQSICIAREAFGGIDAIVHFAAESHVDRSIADPTAFLQTNIMGTEILLRQALEQSIPLFVQVSTDEVYGSLGPADPPFTEAHPLQPNSPYSASKASADMLARSYQETYGLPVIITRCSNNYGPYQYPEKFIPVMIMNALADKPLPVYGNGRNVRDWIYVEDHVDGILAALEHGLPGQVYNFGGHAEMENIQIARMILDYLGKPYSLISFVTDRLGHDWRYSMDTTKAKRELGWRPVVSFREGLRVTLDEAVSHKSISMKNNP